jgi:hypothetical protein
LVALEFIYLRQRNTDSYASLISQIKDTPNEMENALNHYTLFRRVIYDPNVDVGSILFFTVAFPTSLADTVLQHVSVGLPEMGFPAPTIIQHKSIAR